LARKYSPQVITANHLLEGDAVWFTGAQEWSRNIEDAVVANDVEEAEALLEAANRQQHIVAGPYLADTAINESGKAAPTHFREAFRTRGPSNYFHGKQAVGV